jgi:hypothetical protein
MLFPFQQAEMRAKYGLKEPERRVLQFFKNRYHCTLLTEA